VEIGSPGERPERPTSKLARLFSPIPWGKDQKSTPSSHFLTKKIEVRCLGWTDYVRYKPKQATLLKLRGSTLTEWGKLLEVNPESMDSGSGFLCIQRKRRGTNRVMCKQGDVFPPDYPDAIEVGSEAARARGRNGGRRKALDRDKRTLTLELYRRKEMPVSKIYALMGISQPNALQLRSGKSEEDRLGDPECQACCRNRCATDPNRHRRQLIARLLGADTHSDTDGMKQDGSRRKARPVGQTDRVYRYLGTVRMAVKHRQHAGEAYRERYRQAVTDCNDRSEDDNRPDDALLDEWEANAHDSENGADEHHANKGCRHDPDGPATQLSRQDANGNHGQYVIESADGMAETSRETDNGTIARVCQHRARGNGKQRRNQEDRSFHLGSLYNCKSQTTV
jgi:hypothetical protein